MLIVNLVGFLLIVMVVWWFWLVKSKEVSVGDNVADNAADNQLTVTVENGIYNPSRIKLPAGKSATLRFLRKDASPCSATVLFPDADISAELPLNEVVLIELPAMEKGEHVFHCQMQMYKGILLVD